MDVAPDERRIAYRLGRAYEAAKRDKESVEHHAKAAAMGHVAGMNDTGTAYMQGRGLAVDYPTGQRWIEKCAETGEPTCPFNLGMIDKRGIGVSVDLKEARLWLGKAAASGDKQAAMEAETLRKRGR